MAGWSHYFQFGKGVRFEIDGPWGFDGQGQVVDQTDTHLKLRLDIAAWGPAPAIHAYVSVDYAQEGAGNRVSLERDGAPPAIDANATVFSNDGRRERRITSKDITFSVRNESSRDEIDLDVHMNGQSWDFDLERK